MDRVDSVSFAESSETVSSSTRETLSWRPLVTSLPSFEMLTLSSSIHSILLVGSLVSSFLSSFLVYSETGSLLGN